MSLLTTTAATITITEVPFDAGTSRPFALSWVGLTCRAVQARSPGTGRLVTECRQDGPNLTCRISNLGLLEPLLRDLDRNGRGDPGRCDFPLAVLHLIWRDLAAGADDREALTRSALVRVHELASSGGHHPIEIAAPSRRSATGSTLVPYRPNAGWTWDELRARAA